MIQSQKHARRRPRRRPAFSAGLCRKRGCKIVHTPHPINKQHTCQVARDLCRKFPICALNSATCFFLPVLVHSHSCRSYTQRRTADCVTDSFPRRSLQADGSLNGKTDQIPKRATRRTVSELCAD